MADIYKGFDWIKNLTPAEVREHLETTYNLPQCSNLKFWESLKIIDCFLVAKGLADSCPDRTTAGIITKNKIYYRKEQNNNES